MLPLEDPEASGALILASTLGDAPCNFHFIEVLSSFTMCQVPAWTPIDGKREVNGQEITPFQKKKKQKTTNQSETYILSPALSPCSFPFYSPVSNDKKLGDRGSDNWT